MEDVAHWLLECDAWCTEHETLVQSMRHIVKDFDRRCKEEELVLVWTKNNKFSETKNSQRQFTLKPS